MKDIIRGKAYVLGDDIDTDQIIPAAHLVYSLDKPGERKLYGAFALSGVPAAKAGLPTGGIPFVRQGQYQSEFKIIIAGENFGCGSSREHAPVALQIAGVEAVVAQSYARIFYRNAIDGGFLAPFETGERLCEEIRTGEALELETSSATLRNIATGKRYPLKPLGEVKEILQAGGLFEYARQRGMLKKEGTEG